MGKKYINTVFIVLKAFTKPEREKPGGGSITEKLMSEGKEIR